jgi:hypothetical protein
MKKPIQFTLVSLIIFSFTLQGIAAQSLTLNTEPSVKFNNERINKDFTEQKIHINSPVQINWQPPYEPMEYVKIEKVYTREQNLLCMQIDVSDLLATDEEEPLKVEKWMLDPCDWLCLN